MTTLGRTENPLPRAKGFFSIGVQGISKAGNLGNLMRSAHAFGASYLFTVGSTLTERELYKADTSKTFERLPLYQYDVIDDLRLPQSCALVGVELTDDAVDLPSFRHPQRAAYVFGPEKASLSGPLLEACDHVVKIPTRFCVNVATAGAILMYDRQLSMARFPARPVRAGGPSEEFEPHRHGGIYRRLEQKQAGIERSAQQIARQAKNRNAS